MIDTDKYEGHTPADEWRLVFTEGARCRDKQMLGLNVVVHDLHQMQACDPDLYLIAEANHALAQDAPLLLAEVKRLREQLIEAEYWVRVEGRHIFETSEDRLKHYKEYIGDD